MNGGQIEQAIEEALERIHRDGYEEQPPQVISLAAVGYLAWVVKQNSIIRLDGKRILAGASLAGGVLGGILKGFF